MADSNIGALPQATQLDDDSLLVAEQQGQAVKVTGAQFKEFGRQAVVGQVQDYVDEAQAAAKEAVSAVSAVTDMTVEAHPSETASVTKATKDGKVNLSFGLPRGERGEAGPEGKQGLRGPQGAPGSGLTILGHYDTEAALRAAVKAPKVGDAYSVGAGLPYDIWIFDGVTLDWRNYGQLSGGGAILPENVVTTPGGAEMWFDTGDGPHKIEFVAEEEPPLTADDVVYGDGSVGDALEDLKGSVGDGKALIASAITDKGVPTEKDAPFADMADNISQITGGSDTSDATAQAWDILVPKTAYTARGKVEGVIPTLGAKSYTPGTAAQTIANGQYLGGVQTIQGDPNLTSGNIKKGVSIFGVAGAVEQNFLATLTVTADTGAVVTATHTSGAKVEALSTTGKVTIELPLEGDWTVTAIRGVAQYNSVIVTVSSQYTAKLTAEVHIEYYGNGIPLSYHREYFAAASVGDHVIFGGGFNGNDISGNSPSVKAVDAYDSNFVHSTPKPFSYPAIEGTAASIGDHALFPDEMGIINTYNTQLTHGTPSGLTERRTRLAAASIGDFALFGGGYTSDMKFTSRVDAFDRSLTRTTPMVLAIQSSNLAAAANENYALFGGGFDGKAYASQVTAYDKNLVRSTAMLSEARSGLSAARAGNYVLFAGGIDSSIVDAYDLFLTRTTAEALSVGRFEMAAATVEGFALFGGGRRLAADSFASAAVDVYDAFLTRTNPKDLANKRFGLAAGAVGKAVLFAGGRDEKGNTRNVVDIYRYV